MKRKPMRRKTPFKATAVKLKRTRIAPVSRKRRERSGKPGKLGTVRLYGGDLEMLRWRCFERDRFRCVQCGFYGYLDTLEMAHIRTKRNNGDTLDNVVTMCHACHEKSHNAGGKPCPPKAKEER
jgi:5-methylcytosine-specific restriction endonuclease McrA